MRTTPKRNKNADLGASIGLRPVFSQALQNLKLPWLEVISDNYLKVHRRHWSQLESIRKDSALVCHGINLNIGGTDPLNLEYLSELKNFFDYFEPAWISDHLCWTSVLKNQSFDLLPIPYTQETLDHLVSRIHQAQEFIGREWVFENPSIYTSTSETEMTEGAFFRELHLKTGCQFLLDLNNIHVSCFNLKREPKKILSDWPLEAVAQIHLAGGSYVDDLLIDTHSQQIENTVWDLFKDVLQKTGPLPTLIEWDRDFPEFQVLIEQRQLAQRILDEFARISETFLPRTP